MVDNVHGRFVFMETGGAHPRPRDIAQREKRVVHAHTVALARAENAGGVLFAEGVLDETGAPRTALRAGEHVIADLALLRLQKVDLARGACQKRAWRGDAGF